MQLRLGKLMATLLCGLLLAQPLAYAKKSQDDDQENQQNNQHSAPMSGGYLEKDKARTNAKSSRETRHSDAQPTYDSGNSRGNSKRNDTPEYRRENQHTAEQRAAPIQRYEPAPRYEVAPRYEAAPRYAPRGMNLSEAVSVAERSTGGRVLSAEPLTENGQLTYRVKVLTSNGRVQVLFIDAQ